MRYVRVKNGYVSEIIPDYAVPPEKWYGAEFARQCMQAPDNVYVGMKFSNGIFSDDSLKESIERLIPYLSKECQNAISEGTIVQLSDGSTHHFTYDVNDQANVSEMFNAIVMGATEFPYHADGEGCVMYSAQDVIIIYTALSTHKTSHITYHNQLKQYVMTLDNVDKVSSVRYGQQLTGKYMETYNSLMAQAQAQMGKILSHIGTIQPSDSAQSK